MIFIKVGMNIMALEDTLIVILNSLSAIRPICWLHELGNDTNTTSISRKTPKFDAQWSFEEYAKSVMVTFVKRKTS
jgi:hypothetical protein